MGGGSSRSRKAESTLDLLPIPSVTYKFRQTGDRYSFDTLPRVGPAYIQQRFLNIAKTVSYKNYQAWEWRMVLDDYGAKIGPDNAQVAPVPGCYTKKFFAWDYRNPLYSDSDRSMPAREFTFYVHWRPGVQEGSPTGPDQGSTNMLALDSIGSTDVTYQTTTTLAGTQVAVRDPKTGERLLATPLNYDNARYFLVTHYDGTVPLPSSMRNLLGDTTTPVFYSMRERITKNNFTDSDFDLALTAGRWTVSMSPVPCGVVSENKMFPLVFARNTTRSIQPDNAITLAPGRSTTTNTSIGGVGIVTTAGYQQVLDPPDGKTDGTVNVLFQNHDACRYMYFNTRLIRAGIRALQRQRPGQPPDPEILGPAGMYVADPYSFDYLVIADNALRYTYDRQKVANEQFFARLPSEQMPMAIAPTEIVTTLPVCIGWDLYGIPDEPANLTALRVPDIPPAGATIGYPMDTDSPETIGQGPGGRSVFYQLVSQLFKSTGTNVQLASVTHDVRPTETQFYNMPTQYDSSAVYPFDSKTMYIAGGYNSDMERGTCLSSDGTYVTSRDDQMSAQAASANEFAPADGRNFVLSKFATSSAGPLRSLEVYSVNRLVDFDGEYYTLEKPIVSAMIINGTETFRQTSKIHRTKIARTYSCSSGAYIAPGLFTTVHDGTRFITVDHYQYAQFYDGANITPSTTGQFGVNFTGLFTDPRTAILYSRQYRGHMHFFDDIKLMPSSYKLGPGCAYGHPYFVGETFAPSAAQYAILRPLSTPAVTPASLVSDIIANITNLGFLDAVLRRNKTLFVSTFFGDINSADWQNWYDVWPQTGSSDPICVQHLMSFAATHPIWSLIRALVFAKHEDVVRVFSLICEISRVPVSFVAAVVGAIAASGNIFALTKPVSRYNLTLSASGTAQYCELADSQAFAMERAAYSVGFDVYNGILGSVPVTFQFKGWANDAAYAGTTLSRTPLGGGPPIPMNLGDVVIAQRAQQSPGLTWTVPTLADEPKNSECFVVATTSGPVAFSPYWLMDVFEFRAKYPAGADPTKDQPFASVLEDIMLSQSYVSLYALYRSAGGIPTSTITGGSVVFSWAWRNQGTPWLTTPGTFGIWSLEQVSAPIISAQTMAQILRNIGASPTNRFPEIWNAFA